MKQDIIQVTKVIFLALVLTLGVNYVMAWTGPTQAPPSGNTPTPVNVGVTDQVKSGGLGLDTLSVFGTGYISNALGIKDATPDGGLELDVNGNIGAEKYCDENGNNCTDAGDLGGGGNLSCVNNSVVMGGSATRTVNCSAGYTATGGGFSFSGYDGHARAWPTTNGWTCEMMYHPNYASYRCYVRCCQIQ